LPINLKGDELSMYERVMPRWVRKSGGPTCLFFCAPT
jgi:hypothetical protein